LATGTNVTLLQGDGKPPFDRTSEVFSSAKVAISRASDAGGGAFSPCCCLFDTAAPLPVHKTHTVIESPTKRRCDPHSTCSAGRNDTVNGSWADAASRRASSISSPWRSLCRWKVLESKPILRPALLIALTHHRPGEIRTVLMFRNGRNEADERIFRRCHQWIDCT